MSAPEVRTPEPGATLLETDRLVLRRFREDDVQAVHEYMSLPEVCRWIPPEPVDLDSEREKFLRYKMAPWWAAEHRALSLAVERREDQRLIGDIVVMSFTDPVHRNAEIGYVFRPDVAGQGFATEAVRATLDWAFPALGIRRFTARVDTENEASSRLLERLGFRREAHLIQNEWFKGRWGDEYDFAILATEWERLRTPAAG